VTLRAGADVVADALRNELQLRVALAGVKVEETKLTHLAYAPEIAGAMLRRQQAEAVISARSKIVIGAVSMVEMALKSLSEKNVVELDDERRAAMVSNLMVVLCSDRDAQPVGQYGNALHLRRTGTGTDGRTQGVPAADRSRAVAEIERLAQAELRSANGQVEYLLREALARRGVQPAAKKKGGAK
jgi:hypothetical protein